MKSAVSELPAQYDWILFTFHFQKLSNSRKTAVSQAFYTYEEWSHHDVLMSSPTHQRIVKLLNKL